jgi:hypothetical protein
MEQQFELDQNDAGKLIVANNIMPKDFNCSDTTYRGNAMVRSGGACPNNTTIPSLASQVVNAANNDFHLVSSAGAIGVANPAYANTTDKDGNPRDSAPDAGPYEYTGSVTPPPPPPPGPTPPPPIGTVLIGSTTEVTPALSDGLGAGQIEAWPFTAVASGSGGVIGVDLASSSTAQNIVLGLYDNNAGVPGNRLATATITNPVSGWNSANLSQAVNITSGTQYWIAVLGTGTGQAVVQDHATGGSCTARVSSTNNQTSMPAAFSASADTSLTQCPLSAYVIASTPTGPKPGDINGDNSVNIADLSLLLSSYGQNVTQCTTNNAYKCDLSPTPDNKVDITDLSILLSNYGK